MLIADCERLADLFRLAFSQYYGQFIKEVSYNSPEDPERKSIFISGHCIGEDFREHPLKEIRFAYHMLSKKHISYQYENECRFILSPPTFDIGEGDLEEKLLLPLADQKSVIERVIVSPYAKNMDFEGVCRLCERMAWNVVPHKSSLEIRGMEWDDLSCGAVVDG